METLNTLAELHVRRWSTVTARIRTIICRRPHPHGAPAGASANPKGAGNA